MITTRQVGQTGQARMFEMLKQDGKLYRNVKGRRGHYTDKDRHVFECFAIGEASDSDNNRESMGSFKIMFRAILSDLDVGDSVTIDRFNNQRVIIDSIRLTRLNDVEFYGGEATDGSGLKLEDLLNG